MNFKTAFSVLLSVLLGGIFIISAYAKLYPIEPFEYSIVEFGITGWQSSVFIARLLIGLEFACGLLLVFNLALKRITIPAVITLLLFFNIYLTIQVARFGNTGDCGCFGNLMPFTPLQGILKNVVMIILAMIIYKFNRPFTFRYLKVITTLVIILSFTLPFILNPVDISTSANHFTGKLNYKLDLDILYQDDKNSPPKVELRKGKWIIAFMSLTCPHCRIAAKKFHVLKIENPSLPIHMVLNGKQENVKEFFEDTKSENVSWSLFRGPEKFTKLAGPELPSILWVDNSVVERKTDYLKLHQAEIESWLTNPVK
jgi:hypothetical protein